MEVRDYNGTGRWSAEAIAARYLTHCQRLGVAATTDVAPRKVVVDGELWVYPALDKVLVGIGAGDPACVCLGIELVEDDERVPCGKLLKSHTARALRRIALTDEQVARLRSRIVGMLVAGAVNREFKQYAKLLRQIGIGAFGPELEKVPRDNPYAMRWYRSFQDLVRAPG